MRGVEVPPFSNEPYRDFTQPEHRSAIEAALAAVHAQSGREYDLLIGGERRRTGQTFASLNPSRPAEIVGRHQLATAALAAEAIESAHAFFPEWAATPTAERARLLLNAASILRRRKSEFDAWLIVEAGKPWLEAEADVCRGD